MRRLLFIVHNLGAGGMERQLRHLATGFAERGDQVTVVCTRLYGMPVDDLQAAGVRVIVLGPLDAAHRMLAAPRLARLARAHDLVHCTGWDASLWGRLAGILGTRPIVVTEHAVDRSRMRSDRTGASRERLIAWHNRLLDPFTYATVAVAERQLPVLEAEGVRRDKIVRIPNGVPLALLRARTERDAVRAALGVPADALVVVHVARFHPLKRQAWTYEAVRRLREQLGDVHAVFVGDRLDLADAFELRAREEGAHWTHVLGMRDDVPDVLAASDLAVLPSAAEALPMAMIEAMALGVPQVATDVGDVGEVLRRTGAGLVVGVDDQDGFAASCHRILSDARVAAELGERGRRAAAEFGADTMIDRYAALFDAAIAGRPPQVVRPLTAGAAAA